MKKPIRSSSFDILPSLTSLSDRFEGFLLDAYGVFWGGNLTGLLPGCMETMASLIARGKVVGVLTNTTVMAQKEIDKLQARGLIQGVHFHFLITSGEVTRFLFMQEKLPFRTLRKKFFLVGDPHPKFPSHHPIFNGTPYEQTDTLSEADFLYVSIPHIRGEDQIDPALFQDQVDVIQYSGIPMVCTNADLFAHEGHPPRPVVRQGSLAAMYEKGGGEVIYVGKPSERMYVAAMQEFQRFDIRDKDQILMVGDTPETDIRGAKNFGIPSALVTQTGMMADRISREGLESALKALPASDVPNFFIGSLSGHAL